jgi:hypothetical protein
VYSASRASDAWLGSEGITSESISKKEMLCIEAREPEPPTQVEEVEDSDKDLELMSTWHLLIHQLHR